MRDYDPATGRYLQADPLGLVDGASVYGYVRGNPGRWTDPRGEATEGALLSCVAGGPVNPACDAAMALTVCEMAIVGAMVAYEWWNSTPPIVNSSSPPGSGHNDDTSDGCDGKCKPYLDQEGSEHIIDGHASGAGQGKSEFPPSWNGDDIAHGVDEVANNGTAIPGVADSPGGIYKEGTVIGPDGVDVNIGVVIAPGGRIITGYPIYP